MTPDADDDVPEQVAIDLRDPDELERRVTELLTGEGLPATLVTASEAHQLAKILAGSGRLDEAAALFRRAAVIRQDVLGPGHPEVATTLHNLALLLDGMGRADEARSVWAQARAGLESAEQAEAAS